MHTEYLLEKKLLEDTCANQYEYISSPVSSGDGEDIPEKTLRYDFTERGKHLGKFCILPYSDGTVYFFDFEIDSPGKGTGTRAFPCILSFLASLGYKKIRLQVSSENTAAMKLYKDFKVIEQVLL